MLKFQGTYLKGQYDNLWVFDSFFGIEKPLCLPPNIKLIGTINKEQSFLIEQLKEKNMELYEWLEDALSKKEDVVYISLGSIAIW